MRKFILPIALTAVATSFASDMFMPIAPKAIQVGGNLQFWSVTDAYNDNGDATDIEKAEGDGVPTSTKRLWLQESLSVLLPISTSPYCCATKCTPAKIKGPSGMIVA